MLKLATKSGSATRYWSGIKNVHNRLTQNTKVGKSARKEYFKRTGLKRYKESAFQARFKRGKVDKIIQTRKAWKKIRDDRDNKLNKEFKRLKKSGKVKGNFKDFKKANEPADFNQVQELFNSPT